jgi:uncharacterized membrane protein YesL
MNWTHVSNQFIHWFYLILKLTGIWWLFNLPYALLGALLMRVPDVGSAHALFITSVVLLPFVAIPASVATLAITRRYGREERSFSFFKSFWSYYRRDYVKSMLLGGINTTVLTSLYLASRYYAAFSLFLTGVFYFLLFVTPIFFLIVYSLFVDQQLPIKTYFTNAVFLFLIHPINTLMMTVNIAAAALLMWWMFPPLLIMIFPGLVAAVGTHFYQKSMATELGKQQTSA